MTGTETFCRQMFGMGQRGEFGGKCSLGHSWKVSVNNRTSGRNCPHCKPQTSRLEIFFYCELVHVFGSVNWRRSICGMEADILIPEHKIVVEVDGSYWHREKHEKDAEKTKALESLGYSVFRVRETPLLLTSDRDVPCSPTSYGPKDVSSLLRKMEKLGGFSIQEAVNIRRYHKEKQQKSRMLFNEMVSNGVPATGKKPSGHLSSSCLFLASCSQWSFGSRDVWSCF